MQNKLAINPSIAEREKKEKKTLSNMTREDELDPENLAKAEIFSHLVTQVGEFIRSDGSESIPLWLLSHFQFSLLECVFSSQA